MKKLLSIITLGAVALALPVSSQAAEKKAKSAESPAAAPAEGAKKAAETPKKSAEAATATGEAKPLPMNTKVDEIDAKAKTFSHKNKDGTVVKHTVSATTEIKNGEAAAKFEDIKVGDTVAGLRVKKSATEYNVVKITKFGIAPPKEKKAEGDKKPDGAAKPAEKKP